MLETCNIQTTSIKLKPDRCFIYIFKKKKFSYFEIAKANDHIKCTMLYGCMYMHMKREPYDPT